MAKWPTVSSLEPVQQEYERLRAAGEPHGMAEMIALAKPPGLTGTEQALLEGHCNGSQFHGQDAVGQAYAEDAEAAGISTKGKVYKHSLARFPGDPDAWIANRDDAERVILERGWGSQGNIKATIRTIGEPTGGGVSEDLVDEHTAAAIEAMPASPADIDYAEVRNQVREKLKPHWVKQ